MIDVTVVDYEMGNLRSVEQALRNVAPDDKIIVSDDAGVIANARRRVVFPGQGAMPDCMRELEARGLRNAVLEAARDKPFLGICIGLQMLFEHSTEGNVAVLGILRGEVVRFAGNMRDAQGYKLKAPHMGWNRVHQIKPRSEGEDTIALSPSGGEKLDIGQDARFYFVHSYYVRPQDSRWCRRPATIRSLLSARWRGKVCLECNFTRGKAKQRA